MTLLMIPSMMMMYDDLAHLLYLFHWPIWFKALHVLDGPESAGDYNEVQSM